MVLPMTLGDKLRRIRTFRGMTQKELGIAVGLGGGGSDNRITQYENNYRTPKTDLLNKIAHVLRVNPHNFYPIGSGNPEDFIRELLWMEEYFPDYIRLFRLERRPGNREADSDNSAIYDDGKNWPIYPPAAMYFNGGILAEFLLEWLIRQEQLKYGEITREEYFEWKINWPDTCDSNGLFSHHIGWRKQK